MARPPHVPDQNPQETQEWLDALEDVLEHEGCERASYLLSKLSSRIARTGAPLPFLTTTPYRNTIPVSREAMKPGDDHIERQIRSLIRWNALAMVVRANRRDGDLGGHISTFASAATLYEVGFNHFFRGPSDSNLGDLIYYQGHSSPGIYARSYLEGRLDEQHLDHFRQETGGRGLSSYPHPRLMPDYWQFPTVSMGLGPIQAIYQAHVMKYLDARGLVEMGDRKVWAFLGDGECDEPESLGVLSLAGRERLDNLIFVVNCNLQRLDGPVRGNGKIIQELEGEFRGSGWNVIKVVWGRHWDPLFERDSNGLLQQLMDETVDGEYQNFKAKGGGFTRSEFFGKYEELLELVSDMSDDAIERLNRGGHDPHKLFAAYHEAMNHKGQPTVILAKTVKGYGMGDAGESENTTHQVKKLNNDELRQFRDRFNVPINDSELDGVPYYRPPADSIEMTYMRQQREKLGGCIPRRVEVEDGFEVPGLDALKGQTDGSRDREISTTMAFVRILATLLRDKAIRDRIVPIIPDEARTFGMEGMFRQLGIYSSEGQLYEPVDAGALTAYKETRDGQVLEEGINEAGAFAAWLAAATSSSSHGYTLIPFYIFYSMFGFQRVGDLTWAAGDMQARGFLLGATAGRTTLNGEGLQHQDGHSHVLASTNPSCVAYDPCFAYELAVIVCDGLRRMYTESEKVFFYITLMNENYAQPPMPEGVEEGIIKGMYHYTTIGDSSRTSGRVVNLLGSGTILQQVLRAGQRLSEEYDVTARIWSVTSFTELMRDGSATERWNMLHPEADPKRPYAGTLLDGEIPVVAATDYVKSHAESIRGCFDAPYFVLGTDGYGRSDTRAQLRHHFEVDERFITVAALRSLADNQSIALTEVAAAIKALDIDPSKPNPLHQ
ncbi:MAG: pyruvate dehydrogenase (acetyl-transferring), homodimeric type [Gammaproteobacteria bacterium]|nr:pyruvate dehydrogenase (acetyl-transferring), homodimeric type [Gammaproteobacteria bacterium]